MFEAAGGRPFLDASVNPSARDAWLGAMPDGVRPAPRVAAAPRDHSTVAAAAWSTRPDRGVARPGGRRAARAPDGRAAGATMAR